MKKNLAILVAAMLCACCLGLAACGGSSSSSAASGSASASASASGSASASAASDSASASAAASSAASASASAASSDAASDVSPELKEAAEKLVALADEQEALVEKAKAEGGYDAVKAEWDELNKQVNEATSALKPWAEKAGNGELSDADKTYYMKVVVPAASKSAGAGLDMLDLMK